MKRLVGLILAFLMLFSLFGCQWLMPEDETPDTNELQLSAKERFINQIKQDFKAGNKATKLIAKPFIQSVVLSSQNVLTIEIVEDGINLNGVLFDEVQENNQPNITYSEGLLSNANTVGNEKTIDVLNKIKNGDSCYVLETHEDNAASQKYYTYIIDDTYYFLSFVNDELLRIFYLEIEQEFIMFQPDDELIESILEYLENFRVTNDLAESNFAWSIDMCKLGYTPILVDFSEECYYVAAYYYTEDEDYLSYKDYCWVGFTYAESVLEKWEDMTCIIAFQINPAEYCENIKTGDRDFTVELFTYYQPEFINGKALAPNISSGNPLIVMDDSTTDKMYYSSKVFSGILNLECIKLDGDYYVIQYHGSEWTNGKRIENDLHIEYGDYYDYIMEIMVDTYSVVTGERTDYYGRFKLDDIAKLMK